MSATDTYQLPDPREEVAPAPGGAARRLPGARRERALRATAAAELRTADLEAGRLVATMDLGDAALWAGVAAVVAAISAEAYAVAAALSGRPPRRCARRMPPVVRVRELAAAQIALFVQLDRGGVEPLPAEGGGSARQIRTLSGPPPHPAPRPWHRHQSGRRSKK